MTFRALTGGLSSSFQLPPASSNIRQVMWGRKDAITAVLPSTSMGNKEALTLTSLQELLRQAEISEKTI